MPLTNSLHASAPFGWRAEIACRVRARFSLPRTVAKWSLLGCAALFAANAQAAYNVTVVATGSSSGGAWVGNTWTPSANGSTVLASEVATHLASGPTVIGTAGGGTDNGDILVSAAVSWNANLLTLRAFNNITINAALTGTATAALALEYGQGAVAAGNTSVYRISTPVNLDSPPLSFPLPPGGTVSSPLPLSSFASTFSTKRGSDGSLEGRPVPLCPKNTRQGWTYAGCSFLNITAGQTFATQYKTIEINGAADGNIWVYVDGNSMFAGTYYPYAWACQASQGNLYFPGSDNQRLYFGPGGTIINLPQLIAETSFHETCKTWDMGPVHSFSDSSIFTNGYYVRFVPNAGQSGNAYQIMPVLFTGAVSGNTGYTVVDYVINVIPDTTPDAFAFTNQTGVARSTLVTSDAITVAGITNSAPISVTGGEYEINGNGTWLTAVGTVNKGDSVRVRRTSSGNYSTTTSTVLTIGGVSGTFSSTTIPLFANAACGNVAATSFKPAAGLCASGTLNPAGVIMGAGNWTWACDGIGSGTSTAANACSAPFGLTATGGPAAAGLSGGTWIFAPGGTGPTNTAGFIPTSGHPKSPPDLPPGYAFPHGLFDFVLVGGTNGSNATITLTYPTALPAGTVYWKYGPSPAGYNCSGAACVQPHWYVFPAVISGNTVTLTLTDGGLGDDDLSANGVIVDQGGPGVALAAAPQAIPTASQWGLLMMAGLLLWCGMARIKRPTPGL